MTTRTPGTWFLAPANDRTNEYAAGYDENVFASREEAEAAIPALQACGEEFAATEWVAVRRPLDVTRYTQDGATYICAGDHDTSAQVV